MRNIMCSLFGHKYVRDIEFTPTNRRIKCARCKSMFGMDDRLQVLLPWDDELEDATRVMLDARVSRE